MRKLVSLFALSLWRMMNPLLLILNVGGCSIVDDFRNIVKIEFVNSFLTEWISSSTFSLRSEVLGLYCFVGENCNEKNVFCCE